MKVVIASKFGQPNDVLSVTDNIDKPQADEKTLLVKIHSCSLSPGDYRSLLGDKTMVFNPRQWPYIPGGDVCGTVEAVPESFNEEFSIGDKVVATWDITGTGGLAEYHKVNPKISVKLPKEITVDEGAALANSASHAFNVLDCAKIQENDRVLVIGGSGGVGTILVQMLKLRKVSYIAATSTDGLLMKELGVDKVVDYTKEDWSQIEEWKDTKFDCIIDCAIGVEAWEKSYSILKPCGNGGRFVAVVFNKWHINGKYIHQIFGLLFAPLKRQLWNMFRRTTPYYRMYLSTPNKDTMKKVMSMAAKKEITTILDSQSPHEFTTEGVREAWNKCIARKGHGKIVIAVDYSDRGRMEEPNFSA